MTTDQTAHITVALVDDQTPINRYTASYLDNYHQDLHVLFTAKNGLEMTEQIGIHGVPQVVVMDIRMHPINGFEACRWLTRHHPGTRVLVYTFSKEKQAALGMLRSGARGFIAKSSDTDDLADAIRAMASTGRYLNTWVTEAELLAAERGQLARGIDDIPTVRLNVLYLLCEGHSQKEIAALHNTSIYTVRDHIRELWNTFGVIDNPALIDRAHECGLIPIKPCKDNSP